MIRRKPSFFQRDRRQSRQSIGARHPRAMVEALEERKLLSVTFGSPVEQGGAAAPTAIAQGDFNGDGKTDIAVASTSAGAGQVAVYLGKGNGTFQAPTILADPGSREAYGIASFNVGGKLNLAVTNPLDGTVSVYFGNGDGTFQAPTIVRYGTSQSGASAVANIAVGDFGANYGLVVTNPSDHQIDLLISNGNGTFAAPQVFTNNNEANFTPDKIVAAPFTSGGNYSIAYTESQADSPYVYVAIWNGSGFATATQNPVAGNVQALAIGGFSNNGENDIVAATANGFVSLLSNQGDGTFVESNYYAAMNSPSSIATGFFDNSVSQMGVAVMNSFGNLTVIDGTGHGLSNTPALTRPMTNTGAPQALIAGNFYGGVQADLVFSETNSSLASGGGIASMQAGATPSPLPPPTNPTPQNTSPLVATFTGKLPTSVVEGTRSVIRQTLIVKNTGTTTLKGELSTVLFLSTTPDSTTGSLSVPGSHPKKINLKPGKQTRIPIRITSLPTTLAAGNYYLTMQLSDPNGHLNFSSTAHSIAVAPPRIDLSGQFARVPATAKAGRKTAATLLVTNNGNVPAKGALPVFLYVSSQPTLGANPTLASSKPVRVNIRPGKSAHIRVPNLSLPAGSDYLVAVLDPSNLFNDVNTANNTFATATPISVS